MNFAIQGISKATRQLLKSREYSSFQVVLRKTHLQHKAQRSEHPSGHRDAHNIVNGCKDEVEMDPPNSLLGEVEASHHVHQVILQSVS